MKTSTMLLLGGAGVGAVYLLMRKPAGQQAPQQQAPLFGSNQQTPQRQGVAPSAPTGAPPLTGNKDVDKAVQQGEQYVKQGEQVYKTVDQAVDTVEGWGKALGL